MATTLLRAGGYTVLESQAMMAALEPVWSGELERRGESRIVLSGYCGRSSIYHSPSYVPPDPCADQLPRHSVQRTNRGTVYRAKDDEVLAQLRKGCSYNAVARELAVSLTMIRRVAREHGIDRRAFAGSNQHVYGAKRA